MRRYFPWKKFYKAGSVGGFNAELTLALAFSCVVVPTRLPPENFNLMNFIIQFLVENLSMTALRETLTHLTLITSPLPAIRIRKFRFSFPGRLYKNILQQMNYLSNLFRLFQEQLCRGKWRKLVGKIACWLDLGGVIAREPTIRNEPKAESWESHFVPPSILPLL